jgi:glucokinase
MSSRHELVNYLPSHAMLLAGDIGGTKTLLGLFEPGTPRPSAVLVRPYVTLEFADLASMIADFLGRARQRQIAAACFGVAGPVLGMKARLTNVPWLIEADRVAAAFQIAHVGLLNDLEAMAHSVPALQASEVETLQEGVAAAEGSMALIAAGTGLGEAFLHKVAGRFVPAASEGGHADFGPRSDRELTLARRLIDRFGRAEVERIVSGPGLVNIHHALYDSGSPAHIDVNDPEAPAIISAAGLDGSFPCCKETLEIFVEAYGSEAGNLALRAVATGGVLVGGGIAPKILPALTSGRFMQAFRSKPPLEPLLAAVPVKVILNPQAGLIGAAVHAAGLVAS